MSLAAPCDTRRLRAPCNGTSEPLAASPPAGASSGFLLRSASEARVPPLTLFLPPNMKRQACASWPPFLPDCLKRPPPAAPPAVSSQRAGSVIAEPSLLQTLVSSLRRTPSRPALPQTRPVCCLTTHTHTETPGSLCEELVKNGAKNKTKRKRGQQNGRRVSGGVVSILRPGGR